MAVTNIHFALATPHVKCNNATVHTSTDTSMQKHIHNLISLHQLASIPITSPR